jgi:hypothetical protein
MNSLMTVEKYMNARKTAETTAGRWRRKRHHISFHWPAM